MRIIAATFVALGLTAGGATAQVAARGLGEWDQSTVYDSGFSVADLLDRRAVAPSGAEIGRVTDVLFTRDGSLFALVIERPGGETIALPFPTDELGWNPETDYLELPYGSDVVGGLAPFEYGKLRTLWESRDLAPVQGQP